MQPQTQYALSGDVNIAYQVIGEGPLDLVFVMGWVSNIDEFWTEPSFTYFLEQLSRFSRLIVFDKRGTGLSDRVPESELPTLEQRMDDVRAVLDAVGSKKAALFGVSEGGPLCALFAATYPERTTSLVMAASYARTMVAPDYPWGRTEEVRNAFLEEIRTGWGAKPVGASVRAPSRVNDAAWMTWWTRYLTRSVSPKAAVTLTRMNSLIDTRDILPTIRVPTLILHYTEDKCLTVEASRDMHRRIPDSKLMEYPGIDHLPWLADNIDTVLGDIQQFLTGSSNVDDRERVLATVLFADIVNSTQRAAALGDRSWKNLLQRFYSVARRNVERFRGREIDTAGDGYFATFDGPARGVRCAQAIRRDVVDLGLDIRAGLHTGEVEILGEKVGGIAVHIGARIAAQAAPGEVLVSSTVKDLVAGSGLQFEHRGSHKLKGLPGDWNLFVAA
jgi:pimeloyl-ACP methyl ester carboxylesterase